MGVGSCWLGVYRAVAKGVEDLLYLQRIQPHCSQCRRTTRQNRSSALPSLYGKRDRTAYTQPQLLHAHCRLCRQLCQRCCQPSGKGFDSPVILVHFGFSFHKSFVLALYALCAFLELGTIKQKTPATALQKLLKLLVFRHSRGRFKSFPVLPGYLAAWQGTPARSAPARPTPAPWSAWSPPPHQPPHRPFFWRQSRWLCRRFSR